MLWSLDGTFSKGKESVLCFQDIQWLDLDYMRKKAPSKVYSSLMNSALDDLWHLVFPSVPRAPDQRSTVVLL